MKKVSSILKKGRNKKLFVHPSLKVFEALETMSKNDFGALVVIKKFKVLGVFSERDYARKVILDNRSSHTSTVEEVMSKKVICVSKNTLLEDCLSLMAKYHVKHLVVICEKTGEALDFISMMDVVREIIGEKTFLIDQLNRYISGNYYNYNDVGNEIIENYKIN